MIVYQDTAEGVAEADLEGFFVGWPSPPSSAAHLRLLRGSGHVVLARDEASGHVVGFVTAVTDGVLSAYIPLLEVLPAYQGQGVGAALMGRMLARLRELYMVDLLCDPELQPYYERLGMRRATGMFLRNYDRQSGA